MLDLQGLAPKQGPDSLSFAPKDLWPQRVVVHDLNFRRHLKSPLRIATGQPVPGPPFTSSYGAINRPRYGCNPSNSNAFRLTISDMYLWRTPCLSATRTSPLSQDDNSRKEVCSSRYASNMW